MQCWYIYIYIERERGRDRLYYTYYNLHSINSVVYKVSGCTNIRGHLMIMMANDIWEWMGPKFSRHLSYSWWKTPLEKTSTTKTDPTWFEPGPARWETMMLPQDQSSGHCAQGFQLTRSDAPSQGWMNKNGWGDNGKSGAMKIVMGEPWEKSAPNSKLSAMNSTWNNQDVNLGPQ